jgi:hypothetical protein
MSVDANLTRINLVESKRNFGIPLPKGFEIDFAIYNVTAELNTACINYNKKFVYTVAALSLLTPRGIADKIIRQLHIQIPSLHRYMQTKECILVVIRIFS